MGIAECKLHDFFCFSTIHFHKHRLRAWVDLWGFQAMKTFGNWFVIETKFRTPSNSLPLLTTLAIALVEIAIQQSTKK
jgi:hypothetical protein